MKKLILSIACLLAIAGTTKAQRSPFFPVFDSIDINKMHMSFTPFGWQIHSFFDTTYWKMPYWYANAIACNANLWMSGYDAANTLHAGYQTSLEDRRFFYLDSATMTWEYRHGSNYWPGPLAGAGYQDHATSEKWAKIWKVSADDVNGFITLPTLTTSNVPQSILTWPAKGNIYALGKDGVPLNVNEDMAPFVDLNSNGIYEPLMGEYPDFKGDQALWWVYSDRGFSDSDECANPTGVEVRQMVYAYNRGSLLDRAVYFDYTLVNRSANDYHDFRVADWNDISLGWYYDDFMGYDSVRRMGIVYNGTNDNGGGGGHPVISHNVPPMFGSIMLSLPGDAGVDLVPAGSYMYYNNDNSITGTPQTTAEYSNYMRAMWRNGEHMRNDFQGAGVPTNGYGAGPNCNYLYPGDPANSSQWSECVCNNLPSDRTYVHSSNDFTLNSGAKQHVVMAMVATDTGVGGCPVANFSAIKEIADTVWASFINPPLKTYRRPLCCGSTTEAPRGWPSPATNKYYVAATESASIAVYSSMGQVMKIPVTFNGTRHELDISALPRGLYNVICNDKTRRSLKFLKQ